MKPSATVTVDVLQTPEDLQAANDVLHGEPGAGQVTILGTLIRRQGLLFGGLVGGAGTRVFPPDTLVPRVRQQFRLRVDARLRLAEEGEIVRPPPAPWRYT